MKINFGSLPESKLREAFECALEMRKHKNTKSPVILLFVIAVQQCQTNRELRKINTPKTETFTTATFVPADSLMIPSE